MLLGAGSCLAIVAGLRRHRPSRIGPWLLLAGAIASLAVGDVFYAVDLGLAAERLYLSMFVLVAAALLQFTRGGSLLGDRARPDRPARLRLRRRCSCCGSSSIGTDGRSVRSPPPT